MIRVKIKELAQRVGKNVSEISRETGISRNTLNTLSHGKAGGVKFSTIEKLCLTYSLKVEDIMEHTSDEDEPEGTHKKLYRQEAEAIPFTCWSWMMAWDILKNIANDRKLFEKIEFYFKKDYGAVYYDYDSLHSFGKAAYKKYGNKAGFKEAYNRFLMHCSELERFYSGLDGLNVLSFNRKELKKFLRLVLDAYRNFWLSCLFIDGFDVGVDREEMDKIAKKHNLTVKEVEVLTMPAQMTFNNERKLAIFEIINNIKRRKIARSKLDEFLNDFVKHSQAIKKYRIEFDYYKSNYAKVLHITDEEIIQEIKKYLLKPELFQQELNKLKSHSSNQKKEVSAVLKKHKLKSNPLWFFQELTYWREYRKKVNLKGMHVLGAILESIESQTGISKKYLAYLAFDEIDSVFKKSIGFDVLKKRCEKGIFITVKGKNYTIIEGREAASLHKELERRFAGHLGDKTVIQGQTACQGYVRGTARIILTIKDFRKLKAGEILVTGMTRPEFVPVMKRSAGIVTNEGGITCHAAIVSRELGIPCIIGTKNATNIIKDGALIEVRANHGTVRILKD